MLLLTDGLNAMSRQSLRQNELDFIEKNATKRNDFICVIRDGFASIIAFKKEKRGRKEPIFIKEIKRVLTVTNECFVADYYGRSYMGGYKVMFDNRDLKNKGSRWWYSDMSTPELYMKRRVRNDRLWSANWTERYYLTPPSHRLYTIEELESLAKRTYPYFAFAKNTDMGKIYRQIDYGKCFPWGFIEAFMANLPVSEMLCKSGLAEFVGSKRICNLKKQRLKGFAKWYHANRSHKHFNSYSINDCLCASKLGLSIDENERRKLFAGISKAMPSMSREEVKDLIRYLKNQRYTERFTTRSWQPEWKMDEFDLQITILQTILPHYLDYLKLASQMDLDMKARGTLYPKDFDERITELSALKQQQEDKAKSKALKEAHMKLMLEKEVIYKDGFSFIIPTTQKQFVEIGKKLHMCVGSCGYSEKVIKGESLIIGVWKDGKPVNCIELKVPTKEKPHYETLQNRGNHNADSKYQEQVTKDLSKYIAMANKKWRTAYATA